MRQFVLFFVCVVAMFSQSFAEGFHSIHSSSGVDVWAVGNGGNVFHSFDGGATWGTFPQGSQSLYGVFTMNSNVWIVGKDGTYFRSTNSGDDWESQTINSGVTLRAISFLDLATGWSVGDGGSIVMTSDGGISWTARTSTTSQTLYSVVFIDARRGYLSGAGGTLLKTLNGGRTWSSVADVGWTKDIYSVGAWGELVYVTGAHGFCYKSTDGGSSWVALNFRTDSRSDVRDVYVQSADSAFFIGGGGYIRQSVDGGNTSRWAIHGMHATLSDIFFYDDARGWACSDKNNAVLRTTDGGLTWSLPAGTIVNYSWAQKLNANGALGNGFVINPLNKEHIYVALGRFVYMSADRGENWTQTATISSLDGSTHSFYISPKDTNLYAAAFTGGGDNIRRSTDRGLTWTPTISRNFTSYGMPLEMDPDHPDTLIFAADGTGGSGANGIVYMSTDFGATWDTLAQTTLRSPCDIVIVPDSTDIMYIGDGVTGSGSGRMWRSKDAGLSWVEIYSVSGSEIPTISISRLRNTEAYATAWSSGGIMKTNTTGVSWSQLATTNSTWGTDIAKDDPNVIMYGSFGSGDSYLSTDGGQTFIETANSGSNYAYLCYDRETFLAEQSGGVWKFKVTYTVLTNNSQAVAVVMPNGGETWEQNTSHDIMWTSSTISNVKIEYQAGMTAQWQTIVASIPSLNGSFSWLVPNNPAVQARVLISDAFDGNPMDSSNSFFAITAATISSMPASVAFGEVGVGFTKSDTILISNTGTATLVVSSVTSGTPNFVPGRTSFTIPPLSSDTLSITFAPADIQNYDDTLQLVSNAPMNPLFVPLAGEGVFPTSVPDDRIPASYFLAQNYPNPFNPSTAISFAVPKEELVTLKIYNTLGQEVATLVNEVKTPGRYTVQFSATRAEAVPISSGTYFYRFSAGDYVEIRKMLVLK